MQANQRGEFTDITYIYLALLPLILLFLPFKRKIAVVGVLCIFGIELFLFVLPGSREVLT